MTTYTLTITACTPLHIGSGRSPLRKGIDFVAYDETIYVIDPARVIAALVGDGDDTELIERLTRAGDLATFLTAADLDARPDLVRYRLQGAPGIDAVLPVIKDIYDRPYLPGSALKGALRTALLDATLLEQGQPLDFRRLGKRSKAAAQEIERAVAGSDAKPAHAPNFDLFRALRVADSAPVALAALALHSIIVWPAQGIALEVEAIKTGSVFTTSLTIDAYLFSAHAERIGFGPRRSLLENMATRCRSQAAARIAHAQTLFDRRGLPAVSAFYAGLADQLAAAPPQSFLLHLGRGAGWGSKTIERTLRSNPDTLAWLVQHYRLDRGRRRGSEFPATHHLLLEQQALAGPPGWVRVDMEEAPR